jgi:hypothetical protein
MKKKGKSRERRGRKTLTMMNEMEDTTIEDMRFLMK